MDIHLAIGSETREAHLMLRPDELACVHLHLAFPEPRNRSGLYLRRHPITSDNLRHTAGMPTPNHPLHAPNEPAKLPVQQHLRQLWENRSLPHPTLPTSSGGDTFAREPAMIAVPISDLAANLLRPCYHRDGLGPARVFHFDAEPVSELTYWACCCFAATAERRCSLALQYVRYSPKRDTVLDASGDDLSSRGLIWCASLVPLVVDGHALATADIARRDYDLRQILGRSSEAQLEYAYRGWFADWDRRVTEIVKAHEAAGEAWACFYHSILGLDASGRIHIFQKEGSLPGLAGWLVEQGIVAAGLMDSGGSCALFDTWTGGFLNHSWYYREPRGAILVFETSLPQRLPKDTQGSWRASRNYAHEQR